MHLGMQDPVMLVLCNDDYRKRLTFMVSRQIDGDFKLR
jgi:hypothetical protein